MVSYQTEIAQFEECCRLGQLVDESGAIHLPPLLANWEILIDGVKSDRVPADNRDHSILLLGPNGGQLSTTERVPMLRIVR